MICRVDMHPWNDTQGWSWECWDCDEEADGYATEADAREAIEHHRVEVATQQLIDDGELP